MYFSSYTFRGDSTDRAARFDRVLAGFRDDLILQVVVTTDTGLVVYDTCPDRATAEAFWHDAGFRGALRAAGLPEPEITGLGEVHFMMANQSVPV